MSEQEKTLYDVMADLWQAKISIVLFGAFGVLLAAVFMAVSVPHYEAQMIVSPASQMRDAGQHDPVAQSFADPANQPYAISANLSDFIHFEHILRGPSVARILLKDQAIADALDFDRTFEFSGKAERWTPEKLSLYLQKRVKIEPVGGTPLRRMTYFHPQKEFAARMLGVMHFAADELIRAAIRRETQQRIDYLQKAMAETPNPEHRRALTSLLMEQERLKMLVSIKQAFSAKVVEPPSVSVKPVWPDPYMVFPLFLFCGVFLGFVVHGLRHHGK